MSTSPTLTSSYHSAQTSSTSQSSSSSPTPPTSSPLLSLLFSHPLSPQISVYLPSIAPLVLLSTLLSLPPPISLIKHYITTHGCTNLPPPSRLHYYSYILNTRSSFITTLSNLPQFKDGTDFNINPLLIYLQILHSQPSGTIESLINLPPTPLSETGKQGEILRDITRTFPLTPFFKTQSNRQSLSNILNVVGEIGGVGYCQGMNYVVAGMLLCSHLPTGSNEERIQIEVRILRGVLANLGALNVDVSACNEA